ncbi:V [Ovine adenovirus 8]|uniref:V n=1 Tax=Ovine adenovirus 8 TaxID=2601527 RepID=A0A5B8MCX1_9ADEN|nr:V [Ovine adenovirus 8] [Ovine adenovirus 8]QDZ17465.1 V [Ovine adenovirus 8] [Ovine adenovirus 8]
MSSRAIKQELLEAVAPEIYAPPTRRRRLKRERAAPYAVKEEALVKLEKAERKVKRSRARATASAAAAAAASTAAALSGVDVPLPADGFEDDDEPVVEFASAPRRPYRWRGRRVRKVLRPGTVVTFTPGARRLVRAAKRSYDEVTGDAEDLLAEAAAGEGEFAYGKRVREAPRAELLPARAVPADAAAAYMVLDEGNDTPGLKPLTEQKVIRSRKRAVGSVEPTIQVLTGKRRRLAENGDDAAATGPPVAAVQLRDVKPVAADLGIQTVDVHVPEHSAPTAVVRSLSRAARAAQRVAAAAAAGPAAALKTEPMEVATALTPAPVAAATAAASLVRRAPATRSVGTQTRGTPSPVLRLRAPRTRRGPRGLLPYYVLHPSIVPTPGYRGSRASAARRSRTTVRRTTTRRRRTAATTTARRRRRALPATLLLPGVRYHPSIRQAPTVTRLRRV